MNDKTPPPGVSEAEAATDVDHTEKAPLMVPDSSRNLSYYIRAAGAYTILLGCLGVGATLSAIFWSASNASLQNDLRQAQDDLEKARKEIERLKIDLARDVGVSPSSDSDQSDAGISAGTDTPQKGATDKPEEIIATVGIGKTLSLFGNSLRITLLGTQFESDPSMYVVTVSVAVRGQEVMKVPRAEVGSIIRYPETKGFDIQVLDANALSAKFLVRRNSQ